MHIVTALWPGLCTKYSWGMAPCYRRKGEGAWGKGWCSVIAWSKIISQFLTSNREARLEDEETLIHNCTVRDVAIIFLQEVTRKYTSFQFLKVRAMALSRVLSCFEEVCALALTFVFHLQNQNILSPWANYSLVGKAIEVAPAKAGHWTRKCSCALSEAPSTGGWGRRENCGGYLLSSIMW